MPVRVVASPLLVLGDEPAHDDLRADPVVRPPHDFLEGPATPRGFVRTAKL